MPGSDTADSSPILQDPLWLGAVAGTVLEAGFLVFRSLPTGRLDRWSFQRAGGGLFLDVCLAPPMTGAFRRERPAGQPTAPVISPGMPGFPACGSSKAGG